VLHIGDWINMDLVIDLLDSKRLVKPELADAEPAVKLRHGFSEGGYILRPLQLHRQRHDLVPDSLVEHAAVAIGRVVV